MSEPFEWKNFFEISDDATTEDARVIALLKSFISEQPDSIHALELVIANDMMPEQILCNILSDKNCPKSLPEKAFEGFLVHQNNPQKTPEQIKERFFNLISQPQMSGIVLKNLCWHVSLLKGKDVLQAAKVLLARGDAVDGALNSLLKSAFLRTDNQSSDFQAFAEILSDSRITANVLKQCTNFFYTLRDRAEWKKFCDVVTNHPNYNYDVAKALMHNSGTRPVFGEPFQKNVNRFVFYEVLKQNPADKGILSGCIDLLAHASEKDQILSMSQEILKNKGCTQDVVKTLLHKASYSEYFADVCQIVKNSPLCTMGIKEKIAALEEQYPIRLAEQKRRAIAADYISHPEKIPADMSAQELQNLAAETERYPSVQLRPETKLEAYRAIAQHKNCSTETICHIMQNNPEIEQEIFEKASHEDRKFAPILQAYDVLKQQQAQLQKLALPQYEDDAMQHLIEQAHQIVQSDDEQKIETFCRSLFANGEADVYKIDHNAVDWFIKHGTPENLKALNCLRNLYGLNTTIEEYAHADSDRTDAKRALFGGEISAINQYVDAETGELNPHYFRKHSPTFLKFDPRNYMEQTFKAEDYHLEENAAWQKMIEEGLKLPKEELAATFAEIHMPPALANELNSTDLIHYFLENRGIDIESGQTYKLREFDPNAKEGIREQYWKKLAGDEKMVDFISNDLWRKGVPQETIDQIWENCRNFGTPTKGENSVTNVSGISLQIHHRRALKDDGRNNDDNFMVVIEVKKGKFNGSDEIVYNSHKPLHEYDNPCVYLFLDEQGHLTRDHTMHQIKVLTEPVAHHGKEGRVFAYMGPNSISCGIVDQNGQVRSPIYTKQAVFNRQQMQNTSLLTAAMSTKERQ